MSLNDPRWGRGGDDGSSGGQDGDDGRDPDNDRRDPDREGRRQSGADLDDLWNDFNRAVGNILGGRGNSGGGTPPDEPRPPRQRIPLGRTPGIPLGSARGAVLVVVIALFAWATTGFYIVPEGQTGVVTTFGKYTRDTPAGFNWHLPYPVQAVEIVDISGVRKAEIGIRGQSSRLKEALMLTDDENIVDVQFNVQYRIRPGGAKDYLFCTRNPDQTVIQVAESSMREVVGRKKMDSILFESKQEIAQEVLHSMQEMQDRYRTGIEMLSVAIQNAQPPEQVQAAFNDAVKAGQDRERQINEGEAYANAVVPKARGTAVRLVQEAEGHKARVVNRASGDAERFEMVLREYQKNPDVTRERMYIDTMRELYASVPKIVTDSRSNGNLLFLPLDRMLGGRGEGAGEAQAAQPAPSSSEVQVIDSNAGSGADESTNVDARTLLRLRGR